MAKPMVIFDLVGSQAMFRRFYTNSSSLTYIFPPRPTVTGLIAGMMGIERGTYGSRFERARFNVAVSLRSRIRTLVQTVNYVLTKSPADFDGSGGRTQTPIQWILPEVGETEIRYRVYVSCDDLDWLRDFDRMLSLQAWVYPPYLGMSECIATATRVAWVDSYREVPPGTLIACRTVVPAEALDQLEQVGDGLWITKDRVPFLLDDDRRLLEAGEVLVERRCNPIVARFKRPAFVVSYVDPATGESVEEGGIFL